MSGGGAKVRIPLQMKAGLETQAAHHGLQYRAHLIGLARKAAKDGFKITDDTVTKTTRLELDVPLKMKIKTLAKESGCSQEKWLLNVFKDAVVNETE